MSDSKAKRPIRRYSSPKTTPNKHSPSSQRGVLSSSPSIKGGVASLHYDHNQHRHVKRTDKQIHDDIIEKLREERSTEKRAYLEAKDNKEIIQQRLAYFDTERQRHDTKMKAAEKEETKSQVKLYQAEKQRKKERDIQERREHQLARREAKILFREKKMLHSLKTAKPRSFMAAKEKAWKQQQAKRKKKQHDRKLEKKRRHALVAKEHEREAERIEIQQHVILQKEERKNIVKNTVSIETREVNWKKDREKQKQREYLELQREKRLAIRENERQEREKEISYAAIPTRLSSTIRHAPLPKKNTAYQRFYILVKDLLIPSSITDVKIIVNILHHDKILWNTSISEVPTTLCSIPIDFRTPGLTLQLYHAFAGVCIPLEDILTKGKEANQWDMTYLVEGTPNTLVTSEKDTNQRSDVLVHSIPLHPAMLFVKMYTSPFILQETLEKEREHHLRVRYLNQDVFEMPTSRKLKFYHWQPTPTDTNIRSLGFWVDQARRDKWFTFVKQKRHASVRAKRKHVTVQ